MRKVSLVVIISLMLGASVFAQAPAAATGTPGNRIAVMDFNRAITETTDGKKAADQIMATMTTKQTEFEKEQKALEELETRLRTQTTVLSETVRADITRQITEKQTTLTRLNEDAQRVYVELQEKHFSPIALVVNKVVETYATEMGLALVLDNATQPTNIIYSDPVGDITSEIIRRANAEFAKAPAAPAAAPAAAPRTP